MENKCVLQEQFGGWMGASAKRVEGGGEVEGMGRMGSNGLTNSNPVIPTQTRLEKEVGVPGEGALVGVEKLSESIDSRGRDKGQEIMLLRETGVMEEGEQKKMLGVSRPEVEIGQKGKGENSEEMLDSLVPMIWELQGEKRVEMELTSGKDGKERRPSGVPEILNQAPLQDCTNRIELAGNEKEQSRNNYAKGQ